MRKKTAPQKSRIWHCPKCQKSCQFDESNPFRPFCSERCKNFDTANWATESYRIAGPATDPQQDLEFVAKDPSASGPDDSEPGS